MVVVPDFREVRTRRAAICKISVPREIFLDHPPVNRLRIEVSGHEIFVFFRVSNSILQSLHFEPVRLTTNVRAQVAIEDWEKYHSL